MLTLCGAQTNPQKCLTVYLSELDTKSNVTKTEYPHSFGGMVNYKGLPVLIGGRNKTGITDTTEKFISGRWFLWDRLPKRLSGLSVFVANYEVIVGTSERSN